MNANFGILPELEERIKDKKVKYGKLADRAIASLQNVEDDAIYRLRIRMRKKDKLKFVQERPLVVLIIRRIV